MYETSNSSQLKKISPTIKWLQAHGVCRVCEHYTGEAAIKRITAFWRLKWQPYLKCATPIPTVIMSHMKNQCRILILMTAMQKCSVPIPKRVISIAPLLPQHSIFTIRMDTKSLLTWAKKPMVSLLSCSSRDAKSGVEFLQSFAYKN